LKEFRQHESCHEGVPKTTSGHPNGFLKATGKLYNKISIKLSPTAAFGNPFRGLLKAVRNPFMTKQAAFGKISRKIKFLMEVYNKFCNFRN
jgi:hypothetical protein